MDCIVFRTRLSINELLGDEMLVVAWNRSVVVGGRTRYLNASMVVDIGRFGLEIQVADKRSGPSEKDSNVIEACLENLLKSMVESISKGQAMMTGQRLLIPRPSMSA